MKKILFSLIVLLPCYLSASTICLNMIVKDEAKVMERCLKSLKPLIDYWVIVDTGSTDGTQEVIKEFMKDIPGELHERPWKNFAHNRNEALTLAKGKGDFLLFLDADETIEISPVFDKSNLSYDLYNVHNFQDMGKFTRAFLVRNTGEAKWIGVLHEALHTPDSFKKALLTSVTMQSYYTDGNRSKNPNKFLEDAKTLEVGLLEEPDNERYMFYLAQSYSLGREYQKALNMYTRRTQYPGEYGEYCYSLYQVGRHQQYLEYPQNKFIQSYSKAYAAAPQRMECIFEMSEYFKKKNALLAFIIARFGYKEMKKYNSQSYMTDVHLHQWVYDWAMKVNYAELAQYFGELEVASKVYAELISEKKAPEEMLGKLQTLFSPIR
ncbi:MAG: glycosyltransferase [Rhabdochlamydiaceae bacterium]|nr:glycosyltransferase [Candidatus Amphrikana amoebophyrae]